MTAAAAAAEHDSVNHPRHYTSHPSGVECLRITRLLRFDVGNAVKYVWRADLKNGLEDLRKARFYLEDQCREFGPFDNSMPGKAVVLLNIVATHEAEIHGKDHWRPKFFRAVCLGDMVSALAVVDSHLEFGRRAER